MHYPFCKKQPNNRLKFLLSTVGETAGCRQRKVRKSEDPTMSSLLSSSTRFAARAILSVVIRGPLAQSGSSSSGTFSRIWQILVEPTCHRSSRGLESRRNAVHNQTLVLWKNQHKLTLLSRATRNAFSNCCNGPFIESKKHWRGLKLA
jgi:hypothetical protein